MNPIVQLLLQQLPTIIQDIRRAHATQNPNAPPISSADVIAGFEQLVSDSLAKDELLRAALQAEIDAADNANNPR